MHGAGGQGSGLVAAQNVDAAKVLDRRQMFHDDLLACHPQRAARERDRRNHRQKLRRQAYTERNGKEERLERIVLEDDAYEQNEQNERDRRPEDQKAESPKSSLELGLGGP